jgi:hypothetical protein
MTQTVVQAIVNAGIARENCIKHNNQEWKTKWTIRLNYLIENCLPSGSGFDSDIEVEYIGNDKIVFIVPYHPMDENGFYDPWIQAKVIVKPTFDGIDVTARGAKQHNDYIADTMWGCLVSEAPDPEW